MLRPPGGAQKRAGRGHENLPFQCMSYLWIQVCPSREIGGAYFVKENQDRLGVSFESLGRGGSLVYTREVDLQLPVWALMPSRGISLDLTI